MPKISVVVPVYKVEQYLPRCFNSLMEQSFTDFDLIFVDDGSPDNCPVICDSYAEKDPRIHVIHQKNQGLSAARNSGIEWSLAHSNSEWITFIDSDDWVHTQYLELLLQAVNETGTAVACVLHERTSGNNPMVSLETLNPKLADPQEFYCNQYIQFITAWGKLYKKSDFETLQFPAGKLHEDEFTTWKILFRYPQIALIPAPLYAYFTNDSGIMHSNWSLARAEGLEAQEERLAALENRPEFERAWKKTAQVVAYTMAGYLEIIENNPKKEFQAFRRKTRRRLRRFLRKYRKVVPYRGFGWAYGKAYPLFRKPMMFCSELTDKLASRRKARRINQ